MAFATREALPRRGPIALLFALALAAAPAVSFAQVDPDEESLLDEEESVPNVDDDLEEPEDVDPETEEGPDEPAAEEAKTAPKKPPPKKEPPPQPDLPKPTGEDPDPADVPDPSEQPIEPDPIVADPDIEPIEPDLPTRPNSDPVRANKDPNSFDVPSPLPEETPPPPAALPPQRKLELPAAPVAATNRVRSELDIIRHLEQRAQHQRGGDARAAELELELAEEVKQSLNLRNVVVVSELLIHEAKEQIKAKNHKSASRLADTAARFSPDLADAHWMRVRAYVAEDSTQVASIVGAGWDYVLSNFGALRNRVGVLTFIAVLGLLALLGTFVVFSALQVLKHLRYPAHDLSKRLPDRKSVV